MSNINLLHVSTRSRPQSGGAATLCDADGNETQHYHIAHVATNANADCVTMLAYPMRRANQEDLDAGAPKVKIPEVYVDNTPKALKGVPGISAAHGGAAKPVNHVIDTQNPVVLVVTPKGVPLKRGPDFPGDKNTQALLAGMNAKFADDDSATVSHYRSTYLQEGSSSGYEATRAYRPTGSAGGMTSRGRAMREPE